MNAISIIGLGAMGMALAKTLLNKGVKVTVWNRTSTKAEPLVQNGATLAKDVLTAVQASPVALVCVSNYPTAKEILDARGVTEALKGKVLLQLSTGTPQEARDSERWSSERNVDYIDGAILATPNQIGGEAGIIFVSGQEAAYQKVLPLLAHLTGNVRYLGEEVGLASTVDLATLSFLLNALLGFYHGANIYRAEGLSVADFGTSISQLMPAIDEMVRHEAEVIESGTYESVESSVKVVVDTFELHRQHAAEANINADIPTAASAIFGKAVAAGYGEQQVAALFKVLERKHE
ncbi:NAD(P)-dependent oxidoreductase [Noviherbaspirillum album]|nr:NAD(P)-binding domain-containing protein [Noviherbaspirillum sp. CPCC 100848]